MDGSGVETDEVLGRRSFSRRQARQAQRQQKGIIQQTSQNWYLGW